LQQKKQAQEQQTMQSQSLAPRRWWYIIPIVFFTYSLA